MVYVPIMEGETDVRRIVRHFLKNTRRQPLSMMTKRFFIAIPFHVINNLLQCIVKDRCDFHKQKILRI